MSKERPKRRVKLEDLEPKAEGLTPEQGEQARGGGGIAGGIAKVGLGVPGIISPRDPASGLPTG